jgi:hypothetical protein
VGRTWPHFSESIVPTIVRYKILPVGEVMAFIGWLLAIAGGFWLYSDYRASGSMTGKTYYEVCWELKNKTKGFTEPAPSTPYQAGQWKQCEPVAKRAMFASGMLYAGQEAGDEPDRLRRACPDQFSEVPMAGLFYLYIKDTENEGGVSGIDGLLPANWSLSHWAAKRWPRCSAERELQGYPKIIEKGDGTFVWEKPCPKCR